MVAAGRRLAQSVTNKMTRKKKIVKPNAHSAENGLTPFKDQTRHVVKNKSIHRVFKTLLLLCIIFICLLGTSMFPLTVKYYLPSPLTGSCPSVMSEMTKGAWITRPLAQNESKQIHDFLIVARSHYGVSASMERPDKRCGDVGFDGLKSHPALKFRALCDPLGKIPCCYNNQCVARSEEDCSCPTCFDMRQQIHTEYATWKPRDDRCPVKTLAASSSCELLSGSELYFMGDSYLRQMYTMIVMHLTNNYEDSTIRPNESSRKRKMYKGLFQFLNYGLTTNKRVCEGRTLLKHIEVNLPSHAGTVLPLINSLRSRNRSIILLGQGIHGGYNKEDAWEHLLKPIAKIYNQTKQEWPKFVWVSPHAHGLLKIPRTYDQSDEKLRLYNEYINNRLRELNVEVFDTFPFTNGVMAYDGAHYGIGVNMLKIQIVYNYIEELLKKGAW
ncbi:uncharacterized protein LOC124114476 isoform X2 [Haliotis rufescens]|uniref:uncharacterized protein LOC124114476 isoform X2 n=1 Tax=Haliotis rufescens TaxID=6454 RepID=UPI001EB0911A|nr:uncharacterized protein LOC124114476 isoform X2 [Haliotis rufescens]